MSVFSTALDDTTRMTLSEGDSSYRFEVWHDDTYAYTEYQETQVYPGQIRVCNPPESVYQTFLQSEVMTEYLDSHGLLGVRKTDPDASFE